MRGRHPVARLCVAGSHLVTVAAVAACLCHAAPVSAHPLGTAEVRVRVTGIDVNVAVTADAESMRLKLEALDRGEAVRGPAAPVAPVVAEDMRAGAVLARGATLLEQIDLRAGDAPVALVVAGASLAQDGQITVRLRGRLPEPGSAVTWSTTLFLGSYPVVSLRDGGAERVEWLQGGQRGTPLMATSSDSAGSRTTGGTVWRYVGLGFTHIVPRGLDHILFVVALFLLSRRGGAVLAQVTAFTVAHSITLGLSVSGVIAMPTAVVEPLIALSIAYVAVENLVTNRLHSWRLALVFAFGLLHGLGFAEALGGLGLQGVSLLTALAGFNVGVELGQLAVIAATALLVATLGVRPERYRALIVEPASLAIGAAGLYWTAERLF